MTFCTSPGGVRSTREGVAPVEVPAGGAPAAAGVPGTARVSDDFALVVLPDASFAVNVTTVVPSRNTPGASVATVGTGSTRSTARAPARNAAMFAFAAATGAPAVSVSAAGTVSLGAEVSRTVTDHEAFAVAPRLFVAVHTTVVEPSLNVEPLFGVQLIASGGKRIRPVLRGDRERHDRTGSARRLDDLVRWDLQDRYGRPDRPRSRRGRAVRVPGLVDGSDRERMPAVREVGVARR